MSITTAIEKMADPIGYDIAHGTDQTQASLLNGLARGFFQTMPNSHERGTQMCYVMPYLTIQAKAMLSEFAAFVEVES